MKRILYCYLSLLLVFGGSVSVAFAGSGTVVEETVVLGAGCFWGVEEFFRKIEGVTSTQVGYSGGSKPKPTYEEVSTGKTGHAEVLQLKYDPKKITFERILEQFFKMHDPTTENRQGNDVGTEYRSAIFYMSEQQKNAALQMKIRVEKAKAWKGKIVTEITSAGEFFPAEEYHQKYLVKNPGGYDNHFVRKISF